MLRSKRTLTILLALALGIGGVAALDTFGLLPKRAGSDAPAGVNSAARNAKPQPTSGAGAAAQPKGAAAKRSEPSEVDDEVGIPSRLIPADANLIIELSSLSGVESSVRRLVERFDPSMAPMVQADMLLGRMLATFGGKAAGVDHVQPLAFAVHLEDGQTTPTLILPVTDPESYLGTLRLPPGIAEPRLTSHYIGLSLGPDYSIDPDGVSLRPALEPTTLNLVVDADSMREPMLAGMQQAVQMGGVASNPEAEAGQAFARDLVQAADKFELALTLEPERLGLELSVDLDPDSSLAKPAPEQAPQLDALARFASQNDDLTLLAGWDPGYYTDLIQPWIEKSRQGDALDSAALSLLPAMGSEFALVASARPGAGHLALVCRPADGEALLGMAGGALAQLDREALPVALGSLEEVPIEAGRAARLTIDLGVERRGETAGDRRIRKMLALAFGSEQVELQLTSRNGWWIVTLDADPEWRADLLDRALEEGPASAPPELARLAASTQAAGVACIYRIDALAIQRNVMQLMAQQMGLDPSAELAQLEASVGSEPIPIEGYVGIGATRWSAAASFAGERMLELAKQFQ